ncbi:MAG: primase C-terminal domain-containing protein [Planctomycetaceae bacterium]|nr:primase C-terminal domain-containing protein [Planctomycetaceae bacterium]
MFRQGLRNCYRGIDDVRVTAKFHAINSRRRAEGGGSFPV